MIKKEKIKKFIIIFIFILSFFIGLYCERNVGSYNDEYWEQIILRSNVLEYAKVIKKDSVINYYNEIGIVPISKSIEKDHGIAAYYLFTPFLMVSKYSNELYSFLWHLYTFIIFYIGAIILYKICILLFKNRKVGIMGLLIYIFSPRIFADGLYNNKDIVLLTLLLGVIYFGIKFIQEKNYKNAIILGIVSAFAFNVKIIGLFAFGVVGLFYLINYIISCKKEKKFLKKELLVGLTAIIVMLIAFIIITPAIWGNGFKPIEYIKYCISQSSNFLRWNGKILFEGKIIDYSKNQKLPYYYLPKMIFITIPIYHCILFIIGLFYIIKNYIKKNNIKINNYMLMIFIIMIVPILVDVITKAKIYNGWRHFYFIYGPFTLIAIYAIYNLYNNIKNKKALLSILLIFIIFYIISCIYYGINGTAYYNILVNYNSVEDKYQLDYYGVTAKQVLIKAIENKTKDKIYVYSDKLGFNKLWNNYYVLSKNNMDKMYITKDLNKYKKWKKEGKEVYIFYNNVSSNKKIIKGHKKVYSVTSWGNDVSALYK